MNSFDKRLNAVSEKIKNTVGVGYHVTYKDGNRCFMNLLDLFNNMDTWGDIVDIVETPDSGIILYVYWFKTIMKISAI